MKVMLSADGYSCFPEFFVTKHEEYMLRFDECRTDEKAIALYEEAYKDYLEDNHKIRYDGIEIVEIPDGITDYVIIVNSEFGYEYLAYALDGKIVILDPLGVCNVDSNRRTIII